jgi:hypothetical protein
MPKRAKALSGKIQALKGLDRQEEAEQVEKELQSIQVQADEDALSMR